MERHGIFQFILLFSFLFSAAGLLFAQRTPPKILVVNGKNAGTAVVQINGRSYIDINALVQSTNGSVSYQQDRIILTIPAADAASTIPAQQDPDRLTREFSGAGITSLSEIREWKDVVVTVMGFGVLLQGPWSQDYRDRADAGMKLASVAASSPGDQKAYQLLQNQFSSVDQWSSTLISNRQALDATRSVAPNAIQNDAAFVKINECAKALNPMLAGGIFHDIPSCH